MARYDWYTKPDWSKKDREFFEEKLSRTREKGAALQQKGFALLQAGNRDEGRKLLLRLLRDYPDDSFNTSSAHELLGKSYHETGDAEEAEAHYRAALNSPKPTRVSDDALPLFIAELIVDTGQDERYREALELIDHEGFAERLLFRIYHYRYARTRARLAWHLGDREEAGVWANAALALAGADEKKPQLSQHPNVGRIRMSRQERRELQKLSDGG